MTIKHGMKCTTAARRITEQSVNVRVTVVRHRCNRARPRKRGLGKVNNPAVPMDVLMSEILYSSGGD